MLIADLEALLAKATPGKWDVNTLDGPLLREVFSGDTLICDMGCSNVEMEKEEIEANAQLFVATHNALPAILRALRATEALVGVQEYHGSCAAHSEKEYLALRNALAALGAK